MLVSSSKPVEFYGIKMGEKSPSYKHYGEKMSEHQEETYAQRAERLNGRLAMLGFVIAVGTYITTGQILPGVF